MRADVDIFGILFVSLFIYLVVSAPIFVVVRNILFRVGFYRYVWHPNLFEVALYTVIVCLLVFSVPI